MKFNPSEDLKKHLSECAIISYRLIDGSYVLAEEIDYDYDNNIVYIADAIELNVDNRTNRAYFTPWLDTDDDEPIQLVGDKIIGRTETPMHLKMDYHRYYILQKLKNILTKDEISKVVNEMFNPPVDNQDFMEEDEEGEDWKIDKDFDFKSTMDYHTEWRKRHQRNNNK
jgi:hypothetical protein